MYYRIQLSKILMFLLVIILSVNLTFAEWYGLDTLRVYENDWDRLLSVAEWNNRLIVNTGSTGIWMLALQDDQFEFVDSLSLITGIGYEYSGIIGDTLYSTIFPSGVIRCILSEEGFSDRVIVPNDTIRAFDFWNGELICTNSNYHIVRKVYHNNYFENLYTYIVDEFDSISKIEIDNNLVLIHGINGDNFGVSVYSIDENNFELINTFFYDGYMSQYVLSDGHLYNTLSIDENSCVLQRTSPFTSEVENIQDLDGRARVLGKSHDSLIVLNWNNNIYFFDLPSLIQTGFYQPEQEIYLPVLFGDNHFISTRGIAGHHIYLYEITSETSFEFCSSFKDKNWHTTELIFDDNIAYMACTKNGIKVVENIEFENFCVLYNEFYEKPVISIKRSGDLLYGSNMDSDYPVTSSSIYILDISQSESINLIDCIDLDGFICDWIITDEFSVLTFWSNDTQSNCIKIKSTSLQEDYANIELDAFPKYMLFNDPWLYVGYEDNYSCELLTYNLSDFHNPEFICSTSIDGYMPIERIYLEGDTLIVSHRDSGLRLISIADPDAPIELEYYDQNPDGSPMFSISLNKYNNVYFHLNLPYLDIIEFTDAGIEVLEQIHDYGLTWTNSLNNNLYISGNKFIIGSESSSATLEQTLEYYTKNTHNTDYSIYPNPSNHCVNLSVFVPQSQSISFTIFNVLGKVICKFNRFAFSGTNTFSIDQIPANITTGTYYMEVLIGKKSLIKQFVIIN